MRMFVVAAAMVLAPQAVPVALAATPAATPSVPQAATPAVHAPKYTTTDTEIGTLLDDPAARAILDRFIPGMTGNDQIEMARSMTLKTIQQYASDTITDEKLAQIDAEFAKLK